MPHQRKDVRESRSFLNLSEILASVLPTPVLAASIQNPVGKLMQSYTIARKWIRRKAAVADDIRGHALIGFRPIVFEHLQIGVTVDINKSRGYDQSCAIDYLGSKRAAKSANGNYFVAIYEHVPITRGRWGTVNDERVTKEKQFGLSSKPGPGQPLFGLTS